MKGLWFAIALVLLPAGKAQNGTELAPVSLYTAFAQQPPSMVFDAMQAELESIMSPMGLKFDWENLADSDGTQVSVELAVFNFAGQCDTAGLIPHDYNRGPLGWTHISNGMILPFANIDCNAVRDFIQRELMHLSAATRAVSFGRALGRVMAHELYHILARTTHHGSDGVARASYTVRDLLAPDFQLEGKETLALIHSKAYAALAGTPTPPAADDAEHRN